MRKMSTGSPLGYGCVAVLLAACGARVSPTVDARVDRDGALPDAASTSDSDVRTDGADAAAEDVRADATADRTDDGRVPMDATLADGSLSPPPFYAFLDVDAQDDEPSRDDNIANRPNWGAVAAVYANVRERTRVAVPGGSCESVAYTELPRLDLGMGEVVVGSRVLPMRRRQNWFSVSVLHELLPVGQEVLVRFSGAGSIGPFSVSATLPPPTTVLAPRPPMGSQAVIADVASPLVVRFVPINERVRVRLYGVAQDFPETTRMTLCDVDGRTGEAVIPPAILRLHEHVPAPFVALTYLSIFTVRTAPVNVGGYDVEFSMLSYCGSEGLWLRR
jgi:hypothetical protein